MAALGAGELDALVNAVADDYRQARLSPANLALAEMAERLTLAPAKMGAPDVQKLHAHGFDDEAISEAYQAAAYFNYINRIADGLGVDLEPDMPAEPADWKRPTRTLSA